MQSGEYDWVKEKIVIESDEANGRLKIHMWSDNAMKLVTGAAAAVSVAMSMI